MRRVLDECGLVYLGGRWKVVEVRGQPVLLAGNELPWFKPAADLSTCPPRSEVPFRLLLAHSPDQLAWARQGDGDLMLAGHTHGGQIRLPLIGPVFAPSRDGVQYCLGSVSRPADDSQRKPRSFRRTALADELHARDHPSHAARGANGVGVELARRTSGFLA